MASNNFNESRQPGIDTVNRDASGQLLTWRENGFRCEAIRNTAGYVTAVRANGNGSYAMTITRSATGACLGVGGDVLNTQFMNELTAAGLPLTTRPSAQKGVASQGLVGIRIGDARLAPQSVAPQNILRAGTLIHSCATAPTTVSAGSESKVTQDTSSPTPWGTTGYTQIVETVAGGTIDVEWATKFALAAADTLNLWFYVEDPTARSGVTLNLFAGAPNFSTGLTYRLDAGWNNILVPISELAAYSGATMGDSFTKFRFRLVSAAGRMAKFGIGPMRYNVKSRPAIIFTFDDSFKTDYTHVFMIFRKYGYAATSYLISSAMAANLDRCLTVPMVREMQAYGWSFGLHDSKNWVDGYTSLEEARAAVVSTRKYFCANGIKGTEHASYPENRYNDAVVQMLIDEGVRYCRSVIVKPQNSPVEDLMKIRAIGLALDAATNIANIESAMQRSQAIWINGHEVGYAPSVGVAPIATPEMLDEVLRYCADRGYPVMSADEWAKSYEQGCVI